MNPNAPRCLQHVRPYSEFLTDLANNTVARYNFITPHLCHDMHNTCAPLNDPVLQGDTWLSTEVPKILASQAYRNNGVLFITWDEGDSVDGPIGMIVLSPKGKGAGYSNTIAYDHSSTLRTVQEIFGVTPLTGADRADDLGSRDGQRHRARTGHREERPADETEQHDIPHFERPACHQADQDENWRVEYEPERGFTVEVRDDPALKELRVDGVHETVPRDVGQRLVKDRDAHEGVTESGRDEE